MNLIQKHWGILLCAIVFLGALSFLLLKTSKLHQEYVASQAEVEAQRGWFKTLNSDGWRVTKGNNGDLENAIIAEHNKDLAVGHYNELLGELYSRFSFNPELPANSVRAAEMLDAQLSQITNSALVTYKMSYNGTIGGKLAEINQEGTMSPADFKPVFRQLMILDGVLRQLGRSGVKTVLDLNFPRSLQTEEATGYTVTPITLSVEATVPVIQTLLNNLTNDRHMLFVIRNLSFYDVNADQAQQEFTQIALIRRQALNAKLAEKLGTGNGRTGGMEGGMGMGATTTRRSSSAGTGRRGGADAGMGGAGSRRGGNSTAGSGAGRRGGSTGGATMSGLGEGGLQGLASLDESVLTYEEPKRQDNFIFREPKTIQADITLDLIEYNAPEIEE